MDLREAIATMGRKRETVHIPPDLTVYIREMTALEFQELERWSASVKPDNLTFLTRLIVISVVDGGGGIVFSGGDADAESLKKLPASVVVQLGQAILRLNKLTKDDQEQLRGNSDGGTAGS